MMEFKSISPFFETERDGLKCNTVRKMESGDERLAILWGFVTGKEKENIKVTIFNPKSGERFERLVTDVTFYDDRWIISWKHDVKVAKEEGEGK